MGRDETILQAATNLFYEKGFDGVGVDDIGSKAGITGPAIYRHFKGKDEILATLFDRAVDALLVRVGGTFDDPQDELAHLIEAHAAFVLEHHKLASIWWREDRSLAQPYRRRHARREQQYLDMWTDCLARCYPERSRDELTAATFAATGMLNSVGNWSRKAQQVDDLPDFLMQLALGGLNVLAAPADRPVRAAS